MTARLVDYALDGAACRSIGRHSSESLQLLGIEVYEADGPSVGDVLEQGGLPVAVHEPPGEVSVSAERR